MKKRYLISNILLMGLALPRNEKLTESIVVEMYRRIGYILHEINRVKCSLVGCE